MKKINILPPVLCLFAALPLLAANVPVIKKLGTTEIGLVETNPVNYDGKTYVCESVRMGADAVELPQPYVRLRDAADVTRFSEPFGRGLFFACAYADGDKMIVTGTKGSGDDTIYQTDTTDLVRWSEPRPILHGGGWQCYNTSVCKADGRYVMVYERGGRAPDVGTQFTMFFAESTDLKSWKTIDGAVFGRDFYTGSPCLKYHGGWFYFFYLAVDGFLKTPEGRDIAAKPLFRMRVVRSRNLKDWERGNRVVLDFDANDRRVYPGVAFPQKGLERIATAELRNASDIDMCDTKDGLLVTYSWGNQQGVEHSALARVAGCTEREFCESFYNPAWAAPVPQCEFAEGRPFAVMTYNIRHGETMDGTLDLAAAGRVMMSQKPRFVGVQEVDVGTTRLQGRSNVAALAEATGCHVTFAKAIDVLGGQYGNAVLSREWPMAVRRIPLPGGEKRVLLLCEFADCWFGTTHLAVDSAAARQESVAIIRKAVADCGDKPVILTGDWNSEPDSAVLEGMRSLMTILSPTDRNTFHGGRTEVKPGDPNFCIDYIAVDRKHADRWVVRKACVIEDRRTSDHFPVLVELVVAGPVK